VKEFHFTGGATDSVTVTDGDDRPVWKATGTAEHLQHSAVVNTRFKGLKVTIANSGILYIYI
jgi:hypothetical protein